MFVEATPGDTAAVGKGTSLLGKLLLRGDKHPAFARAQHFAILETERPRNSETPGALAFPFGSVRVSRILQQHEFEVATEGAEFPHIAHRAAEMDRHHGLRTRRQGSRQLLRI